MRTIAAGVQTALDNENGLKIYPKLNIYKMREYFTTFTSGSPGPAFSQASGIPETVLSQEMQYDANIDHCVTFSSGSTGSSGSGNIVYQVSGLSGVTNLSSGSGALKTNAYSKVGYYSPSLFFISSGSLQMATLSPSLLHVQNGSPCTAVETITTTTKYGSVHALSANQCIFIYIDEGGVGVQYWSKATGSWVSNTFPGRFMFPTDVWTNADAVKLNYSAAVLMNGEVFVYLSYPTGEVKVIKMNAAGHWSDIFVAIPQDLSLFYIGNAFVDAFNRVHLVGQFVRTEDFSTGVTYNLHVVSEDGITFSMERAALFSMLGYRFLGAISTTHVYYSDCNRFIQGTKTYQSFKTNSDYLEIPSNRVITLNGGSNSDWTANLANSDEIYLDNSYFEIGNIVELDYSVFTSSGSSGFTDVPFDLCVLAQSEDNIEDGKRAKTITFVPEGLWRTSTMSYPFYLEIQSKSSVLDDMDEFDNLYKAPLGNIFPEPFMIDFGGNPTYADSTYNSVTCSSHTSGSPGTLDVLSADTKEYLSLTDYPIIDAFPFNVKIYGWSRIGNPSQNPNVTDSTPASNSNDNMYAILKVRGANDNDPIREVVLTNAVGGISYPPQTWKEGNSRASTGVVPVVYNVSSGSGSLFVDDRIIQVGIRYSSTSNTVMGFERIEIPEITMMLEDQTIITEEFAQATVPLGLVHAGSLSRDRGNVVPDATSPWIFYGYANSGDIVGGYNGCNVIWKLNSYIPTFDGTEGEELTRGNLRVSFKLYTDYSDTFNYALTQKSGSSSGYTWVSGQSDAYNRQWCSDEGAASGHGTTQDFVSGTIYNVTRTSEISNVYQREMTFGFSAWYYVMFNYALAKIYGEITKIEWVSYGSGTFTLWEPTYEGALQLDDSGQTIQRFTVTRKGIPDIYFSSKPYTAFDFEASNKFIMKGAYSWTGLVALAEDAQNYIFARRSLTSIQFGKVRGGDETIIASVSHTIAADFEAQLMFTHHAGVFRIFIFDYDLKTWVVKLTYRWTEADGELCTNADLWHVGLYSLINPPKFRICGFNLDNSDGIGVLPGQSMTGYNSFPSSGTVDIDGVKYTYTGKTSTLSPIRGPFQMRSAGVADSTANPDDGGIYNGNFLEFLMFDWLASTANRNRYANYLMSSGDGINWLIKDTEWKVWITTHRVTVWLLNRARFFTESEKFSSSAITNGKLWVTQGLTGVDKNSGTTTSDVQYHSEGAYCFIDSEDEIQYYEYSASSGDQDASVRDMLDYICKMAGATPAFPGDKETDALTIATGSDTVLQ